MNTSPERIKMRVEAKTAEAARSAVERLKRHYMVNSVSRLYVSRDQKTYRVYCEVTL